MSGFLTGRTRVDNLQVTNLTATGAFTSLGIDDNATTNAITISADEEITTPLQPMFSVYNSAALSNVTGDGTGYTVVFDTEDFDRGGDFATNTFTAPVTGIYRFTGQVLLDDVTSGAGHADAFLDIVTSNRTYEVRMGDPASQTYAGDRVTININILTLMDAADTAFLKITVTAGTKVVDVNGGGGETFFTGELIG